MANQSDAFATSTTDEAIIKHEVALDETAQQATADRSGRPIRELYDVAATAQKIVDGKFQRVALQFPDEALIDSVPVFWALRSEIKLLFELSQALPSSSSSSPSVEPELYILADTSYGNCCVDEVAAQHIDADVVVHYGHSCLSPTARLPVIYVFIKLPVDVQRSVDALHNICNEQIIGQPILSDGAFPLALILMYDVGYSHVVEKVYAALCLRLDATIVLSHFDTQRDYEAKLRNHAQATMQEGSPQRTASATLSTQESFSAGRKDSENPEDLEGGSHTRPVPQKAPPELYTVTPNRVIELPPGVDISACSVLYIGGESLALTNLLLSLGPTSAVFSYDPATQISRVESGRTNKLLMRRYALVQRARDAAVVALLVGTLGVHSYLPVLTRLRTLLAGRSSGRKVYTISVGKLNPAKLANFQEVDIFVLVACPENTLVDSRDFYRPIITPWEMELALNDDRNWTGRYVLDLHTLVATDDSEEGSSSTAGATVETERAQHDGDTSDDEPHFSLISGTYVSRQRFGTTQAHRIGEGDLPDTSALSRVSQHSRQGNAVVVRSKNGDLVRLLDTASGQQGTGVGGLEREWRGLQQDLGMHGPAALEEGRTGVASRYAEADGKHEAEQSRASLTL